eukprot:scaffold12360_cov109-Isochrysis_galbana.AAC.16
MRQQRVRVGAPAIEYRGAHELFRLLPLDSSSAAPRPEWAHPIAPTDACDWAPRSFGATERFQAALAGPSGPITAPGDEEREPPRPRAVHADVFPTTSASGRP